MASLAQALPTGESLHTRDIHTVDTRAVICQQRRKRPTNYLGPVHNADRMPMQAVPVWENCIVDLQVLQNFDDSQGRARQDRLLTLRLRVQVPDVLVHVEDVPMAEALDVLGHVHDLLQVLVLPIVENGVVYDNPVDVIVSVRGEDRLFDLFFGNFAQCVAKPTVAIEIPSVSRCHGIEPVR